MTLISESCMGCRPFYCCRVYEIIVEQWLHLRYTVSKGIINEVFSLVSIQEMFALSNNYTAGSGNGAADNGRELVSRREGRVSINTGQLPAVSPVRSGYPGSFDFEGMIVALRELFAFDRQMASQPDAARCGICYLHFTVSDLRYRDEEGFYVCHGCERVLGRQQVPMLRRQQK